MTGPAFDYHKNIREIERATDRLRADLFGKTLLYNQV